jgi:UDP-N-acetyl-D-mannosaminuronic acid dehydrogenase
MLVQFTEEIQKLGRKIANKDANVLILGLGQVGLPTAIAILESGYPVVGLDIDGILVNKINSGVNPIPEKDLSERINKHLKLKRFYATTDPNSVIQADVVILCVATPLDDTRTNADLTALNNAIISVGNKLDKIKLIIIESTIPPRTMKDFVIPKLEKISGKKSGVDFLVSFCPERISPGNALSEFLNNDRLIGAEDTVSSDITFEFLSRVTSGNVFKTDTITAEISKLAENSSRDVNIAFANELALICEINQADVTQVIKLANTHPRVRIHTPGPGVGGPCLPKDPYLLLANFKTERSLIRTARSINDKMPEHVVNLILNKVEATDFNNKFNILILGCSYKPNVNDTRNSPTEMIISRLREKGITDITVHDPYTSETFGAKPTSDLFRSLSDSRCIILATAHSDYSDLLPSMFKKDCMIFDAVRLLDKAKFVSSGMDYFSIG